MKKILILLIILLAGCNIWLDGYFNIALPGRTLYDGDFNNTEGFYYGTDGVISNYIELSNYVEFRLDYISDFGDKIDDPKVSLDRGTGDCDDYTLVFANIARFIFDVKFDIVYSDTSGSSQLAIVQGGTPTHCVLSLNGQLYSAYTGTKITDYPAGYFYDHDFVFSGGVEY